MRGILVLLCAAGLDLILGDPPRLAPIHPVVLMGRCISWLEKNLRRLFPDDRQGQFRAGCILAAVMPAGSFFISFYILCDPGNIFC